MVTRVTPIRLFVVTPYFRQCAPPEFIATLPKANCTAQGGEWLNPAPQNFDDHLTGVVAFIGRIVENRFVSIGIERFVYRIEHLESGGLQNLH